MLPRQDTTSTQSTMRSPWPHVGRKGYLYVSTYSTLTLATMTERYLAVIISQKDRVLGPDVSSNGDLLKTAQLT
jgi:hypothetical protein